MATRLTRHDAGLFRLRATGGSSGTPVSCRVVLRSTGGSEPPPVTPARGKTLAAQSRCRGRKVAIRDIVDGASNTLLIVEVRWRVPPVRVFACAFSAMTLPAKSRLQVAPSDSARLRLISVFPTQNGLGHFEGLNAAGTE